MWLPLQLQLVEVHYHTKNMPSILNIGEVVLLAQFPSVLGDSGKLADQKKEAKGRALTKCGPLVKNSKETLLLSFSFLQAFTLDVKWTPLTRFLSSVPRDYEL